MAYYVFYYQKVFSVIALHNIHFAELAHTRPFHSNPSHANYLNMKTIVTRLCPHVILCWLSISKAVRLRSGTDSVATRYISVWWPCGNCRPKI